MLTFFAQLVVFWGCVKVLEDLSDILTCYLTSWFLHLSKSKKKYNYNDSSFG